MSRAIAPLERPMIERHQIPDPETFLGLAVTEIRITPVESGRRLLAYCDVTLNGCMAVTGIRIIDGDGGPFLAMPSRKAADRCRACAGRVEFDAAFCPGCGAPQGLTTTEPGHRDVCYPISREARAFLERAVLAGYGREVGEVATGRAEPC